MHIYLNIYIYIYIFIYIIYIYISLVLQIPSEKMFRPQKATPKYSLRRCLDISNIGERLEVPGKIDNKELQLPSGEPQASTLYIYTLILHIILHIIQYYTYNVYDMEKMDTFQQYTH